MVSIASKAIIQRNMNGLPVSANDTVCVVHSAKNMIYTAFGSFSHNNTHAEITMINQLIANNDTGVLGMTVINVSNLNFVMPCPSCVSAFLKLNPVNSNTVIFTPNGYIPLLQILNQQPFMGYQQPVNLATPVQNFKDDNGVINDLGIENTVSISKDAAKAKAAAEAEAAAHPETAEAAAEEVATEEVAVQEVTEENKD